MTLDKDKAFEALGEERHLIEKDLNEKLIELKKANIGKHKADLQGVQDQFLQNKPLQDSLAEEATLREQIDEANVQLEMLQIQVKELEDATEYLNDKKEEL